MVREIPEQLALIGVASTDEQELVPTVAYFVSSKSSRPINILRISDVPPPIS